MGRYRPAADRHRRGPGRLLHGGSPAAGYGRSPSTIRRAPATPPTAWPTPTHRRARTPSGASMPRCTRSSPAKQAPAFPTNAQLIETARQAGVASQTLSDCINNGKYTAMVQGLVKATGINVTPTIRINGDQFAVSDATTPQDLINKVTQITGPRPWTGRSRSASCVAGPGAPLRRPACRPRPPRRRDRRGVQPGAGRRRAGRAGHEGCGCPGTAGERVVGADRRGGGAGRRVDPHGREDHHAEQSVVCPVVQHQPGAVVRVGDGHPAGVGIRLPQPADRHRRFHRRRGHRRARRRAESGCHAGTGSDWPAAPPSASCSCTG